MTLAELGSTLQLKREELGLSIEDISERIRVSMRIIRLIEEGNTAGLPHSVYTRGFIISYADVLHIDKEELLEALDTIFPSEDLEEVHTIPQIISPIQRGIRIKQIMVSLVLLLFVGAIVGGGWFVVNNFGQDILEFVKKPFSSSTEYIQTNEGPAEELHYPITNPSATEASSTNEQTAQSASDTLSEATTLSTEPPVTLPQGSLHEEPQSETASTQTISDSVVVISPKAPCWIRITADGKHLRDQTLPPGKDFTFTYKEKAVVMLGNPSGVNLTINGKPYTGNLKSSHALTVTLP